MKTKYWTKLKEFEGLPKLTDFKVVEEDVDTTLKSGEILTEALCISVDPFTRPYKFPPGYPVIGFQTAKVLESKNDKFPKNSIVVLPSGWKTICKASGDLVWSRVDDIEPKVSVTRAVGAVGMPGFTACYGLLDICNPKAGETVMVNACAGAVGSLVGQIAKIKGCRVVGCCGTDEKVAFSKSLGFDAVFNYKTESSWPEALKKVAPDGIDCFFDNVGGQLASDIIQLMNYGGRICACGAIAAYNSTETPKVDMIQGPFISKGLNMRGFLANEPRVLPKRREYTELMAKWISEGKIKAHESIKDGFENVPKAFIGMLTGEYKGKVVVTLTSKKF